MSPNTRKKLSRNLEYHAAMADYYGSKVSAAAKPAAPAADSKAQSSRPTASAAPPARPDPNKVLADLHADVVKQLQHVLATPEIPAIILAEQAQQIFRNQSPDVRPAAGRFH